VSDVQDARATHQPVLDAVKELDHDRPDALLAFARATLRRLPEGQTRASAAPALARRLAAAFQTLDRRGAEATAIRVVRPRTDLDGRPRPTTVIEVASVDRPFLLSTVIDELERRNHTVLRTLHPILGVERDRDGTIVAIGPARDAAHRESLLHVEVDGALPTADDDELIADLDRLLADVMRATDDHDRMRERIQAVADELRFGAWPATDTDEADEVAALLDWMLDDNLILLGVREYELIDRDTDDPKIAVVPGSGMGLLADTSRSRYDPPVPLSQVDDDLRARLHDPPLLTVTRSRSLATVQRRARMEYLSLIRRHDDGTVDHEVRVLGLFTRKGLSEPARTTPVLREKLRVILEREDVVEGSYDEVALTSLFQALPKDELFQSSTDELHTTLVGLFHAEERREVRTLVRPDPRTQTVSALVAVPRDRYSPELRKRIQALLAERYEADRVDVEVALGDRREALARFLLHVDHELPEVSLVSLQREVRDLARSWNDVLDGLLEGAGDPASTTEVVDRRASLRLKQVGQRLPRAYQDNVSPEGAISDVLLLDRVLAGDADLLVSLRADSDGATRLRAAKSGSALELSSFLPIIESLGLTVVEEVPHRLEGPGPDAQLHDFGVRAARIDPDEDGPRLADAVLACWRGHLEVDALNQLVLIARLDWRDVGILRAYRRMRRQFGTAYTPEYVNETMVANPAFISALVRYIHARFDPQVAAPQRRRETARAEVEARLDELQRLDHDRILRGLLLLVDATLRTNAFRPDAVADETGEPYVAFKVDPAGIPEVPDPVPHREVFVHSPRVEGVHLRAGSVARGGLRWSDRRDDVRTEVLDLVKAQILKNAVIVPNGAKGGFVITREPDDPAELRQEVRRQYVTFVRGLLDVTDDLEDGEVAPPPDVIRHDGDDPYLVVAADRGTATYSDTANALAARYGFWLGDAFASGGSNGYDHKALGVTAKGAWLAVRRHFRELGVDVQTERTTAVGVGDMSGDVFGNGMLRSRAVALVAAFDHRHVFLDPDPDVEVAYRERERLFGLERSSWADYDRSLISEGGGVFPRESRSIPLSDQVRQLLRIDAETMTPPELIRAILRAPVDLLFAGGIGTYVKASSESHDAIADRSTRELRVDASDLRARVVGEGANLFMTQRARIEYARRGGHINQDAIDNAGGVSTSDHEVNIKILLTGAQLAGALDPADRDRLLFELTDDVVALAMRDVDQQAAALSREVDASPDRVDDYDLLMARLETDRGLDRHAEILPTTADLHERAEAGAGLTRPELATLLAWAKRDMKEALLDSDVVDVPLLERAAFEYFPGQLAARFPEQVAGHRLRRELVATVVTNDLVDRMGVSFAAGVAAQAGRSLPEVVLAYRVARDALDMDRRWSELESLEELHDAGRLLELDRDLQRLVAGTTMSLVSSPVATRADELLGPLTEVAAELISHMLELGTTDQRRGRLAHARWLMDDLVGDDLARFLACAQDLTMIPDVAMTCSLVGTDRSAVDVADAFLRLGDALGVDDLERVLRRTEVGGGWARRQLRGLATDLRRCRRDATLAALHAAPEVSEREAVDRFVTDRRDAIARGRRVVDEATDAETDRLEAIAVAVRAVRDVIEPTH
jgi:glutamate dehydrogenase